MDCTSMRNENGNRDDLREILKELIEDQISKQEFTVSIRSTNEAGGLSNPM